MVATEELGIKVEDEEVSQHTCTLSLPQQALKEPSAPAMPCLQVDKAERLVYLAKIREIFRQQLGRRVDDEGLLLYLLCSLKGFLQVRRVKSGVLNLCVHL